MSQSLSPDLLAALCHDLRGPLGSLSTWTHVLNSSAADEATRARALASLGSDVRNLAGLIEQLSQLSILLSDAEPGGALGPIDLVPFVKSLIAAAEQDGGGITELRADDTSPTVLADPIRLRQALWCLLKDGPGAGAQTTRSLNVRSDETQVTIALETRPPRAVPLALARACVETQGGTLDTVSRDGKSRVVIHLKRPAQTIT